ncbi:CoA-transferase [Variovorax paradoxus]|jgi:itaconate CoA-transferase|uniref:CaiB/BaiF CoA transferase family protein n=1 Tax=Variovorax paradoxus TaxID=34073 RepID=UPI0006E4EF68|nr:CoA-transferase [Variovorax paradoxus]KPV11960.1 CoA-transferase [Variovorax paradoxus]KPV13820.1 CoA-transferase [Variovorax paradoxus]KPV25298.1 CoA-transferase [Variovorax paradoxus]KPV35764.1 CoA-transferase [Variovorax paradoxus]
MARTSGRRPLEGITVVTLEHAVAAPFATRQLADMGARVIKIERPGAGDFARAYDRRVRGEASYFVWINRSKESITLDVKHPEARQVLARLLGQADVLVQNLAPGAAARLGLSEEALRPTHKRLIVCDISGYGSAGPFRDKKAYDLLIQAEAGLLSVTGSPEEMARAGISVADIAAGMYAYSSVLAALIQRGITGEGSHIDVSMLECLAEWMGNPLYYGFEGQAQAARAGASHPSIYPYGPFTAGDGKTVLFGLQNEREWKAFCEQVLAHPELATDERFDANAKRSAHRVELKQRIESLLQPLTAAQCIERLDAANIGNASVNDIADVWAHPQLRARERWLEVGSPVGPIPALKPPADNDRFAPRMDPVPALGEHTDAILQALGYGPEDIARLRDSQIL